MIQRYFGAVAALIRRRIGAESEPNSELNCSLAMPYDLSEMNLEEIKISRTFQEVIQRLF